MEDEGEGREGVEYVFEVGRGERAREPKSAARAFAAGLGDPAGWGRY